MPRADRPSGTAMGGPGEGAGPPAGACPGGSSGAPLGNLRVGVNAEVTDAAVTETERTGRRVENEAQGIPV